MTLRGQHLVDAVVNATADYYGLPAADLLGSRAYRCLSRARHVAMYLIRAHSDWSYPLIGQVFERDHSSIYGGCQRVASDELLVTEATEIWEAIERADATAQIIQIDHGRGQADAQRISGY